MEYTKSKTVVQTEYADIDLFFKPHPITGDVSLKYDDAAVKRSVRNMCKLISMKDLLSQVLVQV